MRTKLLKLKNNNKFLLIKLRNYYTLYEIKVNN